MFKGSSQARQYFYLLYYISSSCLFLISSPLSAQLIAENSVTPVISYLLLESDSVEQPTPTIYRIPDSGLLIGGNYPTGNNSDCSGELISQQTCSHGLDVDNYDNSDGRAGFSYTKLDSNGESLAASAESWHCVRDNVTGFIWEVKTKDGGVQDKDNTYFWGGLTAGGRSDANAKGVYYDDWNPLVVTVNSNQLCGFSDWRVPTIKELMTLIDAGKTTEPSIDTDYFPNTISYRYWSSTPRSPDSNDTQEIGRAYRVGFGDSVDRAWLRSGQFSHYHVRLIRTDDYQTYEAEGDNQ